MHKEELTMSEKEKQVRKQVETHAPQQQQRKSKELALAHQSPKSSPKKVRALNWSKRNYLHQYGDFVW